MPIRANWSSTTAWCSGGGFSASIALSVFHGPSGSCAASAGAYTSRRSGTVAPGLPHMLSGVSRNCSCNARAAGTSAGPSTRTRPMIRIHGVGAGWTDRTPGGSFPCQPGPQMAKCPASLPVVRCPT